MTIEFDEISCIAVKLKSLNENDFNIINSLPTGFCIVFPGRRTEALDMIHELSEYGFSKEFVDFVYTSYTNDYKIIALSNIG